MNGDTEQGTIVDRIDYNITNVAASVEQGVKELVKVGDFYTSYDRLTFCVHWIVSTIFMCNHIVLLFIIILHPKNYILCPCGWLTAGRRNSKERRHGDVCNGAHCSLCIHAFCLHHEENTWVLTSGVNIGTSGLATNCKTSNCRFTKAGSLYCISDLVGNGEKLR